MQCSQSEHTQNCCSYESMVSEKKVPPIIRKSVNFKLHIKLQCESFSAIRAEIVQIAILHFCLFGQLSVLKLATPTIMTLWTKRTLFSF